MRIAYELDEAILNFSNQLESIYNLSPIISEEHHITNIIDCFKSNILVKLKLWEYLVINVENTCALFEGELSKFNLKENIYDDDQLDCLSAFDLYERFKKDVIISKEGVRFGKSVNFQIAIQFLLALKKLKKIPIAVQELSEFKNEFKRILNEINLIYYKFYDDVIGKAMVNLASRLRYERLDSNGPKLGPISAVYFIRF